MLTPGSFTLTAGTVDVNGNTLNIDGDYTQSGGTMMSSSGFLDVAGNFSISGGTLEAIRLDGATITINQTGGDITDFTFRNSTGTHTLTSDLTILGDLFYSPVSGSNTVTADTNRKIHLFGNFWMTAGGNFGASVNSNLTLSFEGGVPLDSDEAYRFFLNNIGERHSLQVIGVALSFWNPRGKSNETFLNVIDQTFPGKLLQNKVRRDISVSEASVYGKSIFEIAPKSRASEDYQQLAEELLQRL